ncbi:MAG TPA: HIT domain-containing protein [Patescibacteria group bacterium]|nr:HIT domain-containing protein [Patescibacteria group bacterium]
MEKDCIFCRIVHREIPAYKIYEDGLFFGFLDINPRVVGHSLLIPKKHYQWVYEVPEFKQFWAAALTITRAMQKTLSPTFVTYVTHGLEVSHAHIHILPRKHEREFVPAPITIPKKKMEEIARLIGSAV